MSKTEMLYAAQRDAWEKQDRLWAALLRARARRNTALNAEQYTLAALYAAQGAQLSRQWLDALAAWRLASKRYTASAKYRAIKAQRTLALVTP